MKQLFIFDLDGTLVNAYPAIIQSVNFTLKKLGFPPRSNLTIIRAVGMGDRHLMAHFVGEDLADRAIRYYRAHHLKALAKGARFLPGAQNVLGWCKSKGFLLGIATNRPTLFTKKILKSLKAERYFDKVLCADKSPKPKPYPDMLLKICKDLKVKKEQAVYIGDMVIDIQCGANAGIKTIAVATGSNSKNELKQAGPYKIIKPITQMKQMIMKGII